MYAVSPRMNRKVLKTGTQPDDRVSIFARFFGGKPAKKNVNRTCS